MKIRNVLQGLCLLLILVGVAAAQLKLINKDIYSYFYGSGAIGLILVMLVKVAAGDFRKKEKSNSENSTDS